MKDESRPFRLSDAMILIACLGDRHGLARLTSSTRRTSESPYSRILRRLDPDDFGRLDRVRLDSVESLRDPRLAHDRELGRSAQVASAPACETLIRQATGDGRVLHPSGAWWLDRPLWSTIAGICYRIEENRPSAFWLTGDSSSDADGLSRDQGRPLRRRASVPRSGLRRPGDRARAGSIDSGGPSAAPGWRSSSCWRPSSSSTFRDALGKEPAGSGLSSISRPYARRIRQFGGPKCRWPTPPAGLSSRSL